MKRYPGHHCLLRMKDLEGNWLQMQSIGIDTPQYFTRRWVYRENNRLYCKWQNCFIEVTLEPF